MVIRKIKCGKHLNSPPAYDTLLYCPDGTFDGFVKGYISGTVSPSFEFLSHDKENNRLLIEFTFGTYIYEEIK